MLASMLSLPSDRWIVLIIMGLSFTLFLFETVRVDAVAILVLVLLGVTHLLPLNELFSGFGSQAVIMLMAIMILSAGLEKAGVMHVITRYIVHYGGTSERRLMAVIMILAGLVASSMQAFGATVLFLPVLNRIALRTNIAKSKLLMPMAFAALLGSTLTLIGSNPLILLNDFLRAPQTIPIKPFGMFDILPIGLSLLVVGIVYFFWIAWRWLPKGTPLSEKSLNTLAYFQRTYGVGGDIHMLLITQQSPLTGLLLKKIELRLPPELSIIAIYTRHKTYLPPRRRTVIEAGNVLAVMGPQMAVDAFMQENHLHLRKNLRHLTDVINPAQTGLAEVVIPPSSSLVGKKLKTLHLRRAYSLQVLAIHRGKRVRRGKSLRQVMLKPGDTLAIFSRWQSLYALEQHQDFVVITSDYPRETLRLKKLPTALASLTLAFVMALIPGIPIALALLVGAVAMVYTQVLTLDEAYSTISWKTVFLLAGMIPLGYAAEHTGTAAWLATQLLLVLRTPPAWVLQLSLALLATLLALVVSNIGAMILLAPIAIQLALSTGSSPRVFALTVALACNNVFLLPTHQANALIAGPGDYRSADFLRIGAPLSLLFLTISLVVIGLVGYE